MKDTTRNKKSHLYFLEFDGKIKVGKSRNPYQRAYQISSEVGGVGFLEIIKVVAYGGDYEKDFHSVMKRHRVEWGSKREWYEKNEHTMKFVNDAEKIVNDSNLINEGLLLIEP